MLVPAYQHRCKAMKKRQSISCSEQQLLLLGEAAGIVWLLVTHFHQSSDALQHYLLTVMKEQ